MWKRSRYLCRKHVQEHSIHCSNNRKRGAKWLYTNFIWRRVPPLALGIAAALESTHPVFKFRGCTTQKKKKKKTIHIVYFIVPNKEFHNQIYHQIPV